MLLHSFQKSTTFLRSVLLHSGTQAHGSSDILIKLLLKIEPLLCLQWPTILSVLLSNDCCQELVPSKEKDGISRVSVSVLDLELDG